MLNEMYQFDVKRQRVELFCLETHLHQTLFIYEVVETLTCTLNTGTFGERGKKDKLSEGEREREMKKRETEIKRALDPLLLSHDRTSTLI